MRKRGSPQRVFLSLSIAGLLVLAFVHTPPALALVSCGDTITAATTLTDLDPVTFTVCPCDGLFVDRGQLDLAGHTIRGSGICAGLTLRGGVVVGGGRITAFETGVFGQFEVSTGLRIHHLTVVGNTGSGIVLPTSRGNVIEDCVVSQNGGSGMSINGIEGEIPIRDTVRRCVVENNHGHGILASFNQSLIEANVVRRNGSTGIDVSGSGNTITRNRAEENGGDGLEVSNHFIELGGTSATRNTAQRNGRAGVRIRGIGVSVESSRSSYNGDEGFAIAGRGHLVMLSNALANGRSGFLVTAVDSRLQRNRSDYNGAFGIEDATTGGGAGGTANTYTNNRCTGNDIDKSSPQGLCQ
jgi:parallel beta-helix repeat protein